MTNILKIIGDRIVIRRKPLTIDTSLHVPENVARNDREPYEAEVVLCRDVLSEEIKPGDTILMDCRGSQPVVHNGEALDMVSTLDVIGVIEQTGGIRP